MLLATETCFDQCDNIVSFKVFVILESYPPAVLLAKLASYIEFHPSKMNGLPN